MKQILSVAFIVVLAACIVPKMVASSGEPSGRESEPVPWRIGVVLQIPLQGSSAAAAVLRASTQVGRTADAQISSAIGAISHGGGIVWADYSTNQTWAACPDWGTQNITLVLYPVTYTIAAKCTIP